MSQREKFEAWKGPHYMSRCNAPGEDPGDYQDSHTNMAWKAWQAAIAASQQAAPRTALTDEQIDQISEQQKIWRSMTPDGHTCIDMTRQFARAIEAAAGLNPALVEALKSLYRGYVNTLEGGRDKILDLGGDCDPVDRMEADDPVLRKARAALASLPPTQEAT